MATTEEQEWAERLREAYSQGAHIDPLTPKPWRAGYLAEARLVLADRAALVERAEKAERDLEELRDSLESLRAERDAIQARPDAVAPKDLKGWSQVYMGAYADGDHDGHGRGLSAVLTRAALALESDAAVVAALGAWHDRDPAEPISLMLRAAIRAAACVAWSLPAETGALPASPEAPTSHLWGPEGVDVTSIGQALAIAETELTRDEVLAALGAPAVPSAAASGGALTRIHYSTSIVSQYPCGTAGGSHHGWSSDVARVTCIPCGHMARLELVRGEQQKEAYTARQERDRFAAELTASRAPYEARMNEMRLERDAARRDLAQCQREVERLKADAARQEELEGVRASEAELDLMNEVDRLKEELAAASTPAPADLDGWTKLYLDARDGPGAPFGDAKPGIAAILVARDAWCKERLVSDEAVRACDEVVSNEGTMRQGLRAAVEAALGAKVEPAKVEPAPLPPLPEVPLHISEIESEGGHSPLTRAFAHYIVALDAALRARAILERLGER